MTLGVVVGLAAPAAASGPPDAGCSVFPWVQTYRGWGPAEHFGSTVTVVYEAGACSANLEGDVAKLEASGTATIFKGDESGGEVLDRRGFSNTATWTAAEGEAWPIEWWSCDVESLDYDWRIDGVYSFSMRAEDGRWAISVSPDSVDWSYTRC